MLECKVLNAGCRGPFIVNDATDAYVIEVVWAAQRRVEVSVCFVVTRVQSAPYVRMLRLVDYMISRFCGIEIGV